jgi:guanine deaminase
MADDRELLEMAVLEALDGIRAGDGGPFGCVIAKDGAIIAKGHNRVLIDKDPTAHGEIVAIRKACDALETIDLSDCTLYTSAEPCPMCRAAICWTKIGKVFYAASMKDVDELLGFKDLTMAESLVRGEDIVASEQMDVDGKLLPLQEYKSMQGTIY